MRKSYDEALIESAPRMGPRYACLMGNAPWQQISNDFACTLCWMEEKICQAKYF